MTVTARLVSDGWGQGGRGGNLDVDAEHVPSEGVQVTIQPASGGVTVCLTLDEAVTLRDALSRELARSGREDDEPDEYETVERVAKALLATDYPTDPWGDWATRTQESYRKFARSAIAAMRETS